MLGHFILDDAGEPQPVELLVWAEWFERTQAHGDRVVLQTHVTRRGRTIERPFERARGVFVSTVFLGLDHNFYGDGPPVLWETMIFAGPLSGEMRRYSSKLDALTGHAAMVERARKAAHVPRRLRKAISKRDDAFAKTLRPREARAVWRFERRHG